MNPKSSPELDKMRAETLAMLRAVLISSPLGVRFEKLYRDYKQLTGKTIPFKELGFDKLESFIQSIPDVARAEKGADGEWILKGVASEADKHVAKLISKQKKPKVKKSAKLMIAKKSSWFTKPRIKISTPVKPPPKQHQQRFVPPRMQKLQQQQPRQIQGPSGRGRTTVSSLPDAKHSVSRGQPSSSFGSLFHKTTESVRSSRIDNNRPRLSRSNSQEKASSKGGSGPFESVSVSISNNNTGRNVRAVSVSAAPEQALTAEILDDPSVVKWIKAEIKKASNGLWASRLAHLFQEKFKKALSENVIKELKFCPEIAIVDEPIEGRFLLYAPPEQSQPAVRPVESLPTHVVADVILQYELPDVGSSISVYICHVESVGCFYVSKMDAISETLNTQLLKHYQYSVYKPDEIPSVEPDQVFCAQFSEDRCFYRARVVEVVDSKNVRVLYADFGNQEVVEINCLRVLVKEFQFQPVQALQCYLDGIQPLNEDQDWSEAALNKFQELVLDKELRMNIKNIEDNVLCVNLYDESQKLDIGDELTKAGLAVTSSNFNSTPSSSSSSLSSLSSFTGAIPERNTPTKKEGISRTRRVKSKSPGVVELPKDQFLDVFVCNITGTYNVFLRLVGNEYSNKLEAIQESMTCYYRDSQDEITTDPVAGDLFALLSDEVWCRVKVLGVSGTVVSAFFVDYGDKVETTKADLRILAPQFQQLPLQVRTGKISPEVLTVLNEDVAEFLAAKSAGQYFSSTDHESLVFECALNGLPKTKNADVVGTLQKLIMGEVCVAEVIKRSADLVFVELLDTRHDATIVVNDVIRKLVIPDEELKPVLPKVGEIIEVRVPYVSPEGSVFLHPSAPGARRLEELVTDLTEHYTSKRSKASEFVSNLTAGKICCVKCPEDENWYRVKIISASDKHAVVMYVDYGNYDEVPSTNLREPTEVNEHVLSLPFQALECQLYDVPKDDWSEELANKIMDVISEGTVTAEILSEGECPFVSLLVTLEEKEDETVVSTRTERLTDLLGIAFHGELLQNPRSEDNVDDTIPNNGETNESANGEVSVSENENPVVGEDTITVDERDKDVVFEVKTAVEKNTENAEAMKDAINEEKTTEEQAQSHVDSSDDAGATGEDTAPVENVCKWKEVPLSSGWIDVLVTDVKDPDNFTFQILPNLDEFNTMSDEMNDFYQKPTMEVNLVKGHVYAVCDGNDDWCRAVVESVLDNGKVYVIFVDYGGDSTIDTDDIRSLEDRFLKLPFQGVQASLAGIKSSKTKWSKACIKDFKFYTLNRKLVAKVTSGNTSYRFGQTRRVKVELYDTSDPVKDVVIAEKIIEHHKDSVSKC